jgi:hypothetical protein
MGVKWCADAGSGEVVVEDGKDFGEVAARQGRRDRSRASPLISRGRPEALGKSYDND